MPDHLNPSAGVPEPMNASRHAAMTLRDVYHVLFRHWRKISVFFLAVTATASVALLSTPPVFVSEAKLLVKRGRESMTLDPTAATGEVIPIYQDWENQLNSEMEILSSRELLVAVVKAMGVDAFLGGRAAPTEPPHALEKAQREVHLLLRKAFRLINPWSRGASVENTDLERAADILLHDLHFELLGKSNVIALSYRTSDPRLSQTVLARLIELYLEKHLEVYRTPGSYHFFNEQRDQLQQQLKQVEEELSRLKTELGMSSIDAQRALLMERIHTLQEGIEKSEAFIASATARLNALGRVQAGPGEARPESLSPEGRLPIGRQDYNEMKVALITEEAELAARRAEVATWTQQLQTARRELVALNDPNLLDRELRIAQLEREKSLVDTKYRQYSENLEQARIHQALETEKISNIAIVQPATYPATSEQSPRALKLLLAMLTGLLGGIGLAFGWEFLDGSIRKPDDVESRLHLPTLVSIPLLGANHVSLSGSGGGRDPLEASRTDGRWDLPPESVQYYEILRDRLLLGGDGAGGKPLRIGVTSCYLGEGVSTVAINLALTLARRSDRPVLLVDANLRNPSLHERLKLKRGAGVAEILADGSGAIQPVEDNLFLLGAGEPHRNLPDTVAPQKPENLGRLLNDGKYAFVVMDLPPVSEGAFTLRLARLVTGILLVIESEKVRGEVARRARNLLLEGKAPLFGAVLNKRRFYVPDWIYHRL